MWCGSEAVRAKAWVDGGGNSGYECACACVIELEDGAIHEFSKRLGQVTNNEAEYEGVALALRSATALGVSRLTIYSDSQIIVRQIQGFYLVRKIHLQPYNSLVIRLASCFESVSIEWVRREQNRRADKLCRKALKPEAPRRNPLRDVSPSG